jgi:hypothetical protein
MQKILKSRQFGGISKFRLWADFGSFGQFWAEFAEIFKTP